MEKQPNHAWAKDALAQLLRRSVISLTARLEREARQARLGNPVLADELERDAAEIRSRAKR